MSKIDELLRDAPVLVEGGMGTMLMQAGLPPGAPGEQYLLDNPDAVEAIHREYAAAGVRVHITNTFNGNRLRLTRSGLGEHFEEINRIAVRVARQAADGQRLVAGSIGPSGEMLAPLGPISALEAADMFAEQAGILVDAGVDLLWIETMTDIAEAIAALNGCRRVWGGPISVSMTFSDTPRGYYTMMGNAVEDCAPQLENAGATIIGSNCQLTAEGIIPLAAKFKELSSLPVLIEPNAGIPEIHAGKVEYKDTPELFAKSAERLAELGVELIGGCCGTTPAFIAAARDRLAALRA
ncbi:MAG: homocysteine S-methyltransferase family protein [Phycisphaerales bacterium]|nr:homocysteine S-methyltransferase family protein [Phycisphaerales bacterium]